MEAKYATTCPACRGRIAVGDWIVKNGELWVHGDCFDVEVAPEKKDHPVCTECWIMHPPGPCE